MEDELSPQQAERVRRLLADARHTERVPADVAARLDRVLADLAADPDARPRAEQSAATTDGAGVVRLDERRRTAGKLLLVAAAFVVGGVAAGQVVGGTGGAPESAMSGADSGSEEGLPAPDRDGGGDRDEGALTDDGAPGAVSAHRRSISKQPARDVRSERFATDARRLRALAEGRTSQDAASEAPRAQLSYSGCEAGPWGGGRYLRVSVDRQAGWLVYRPPRGDTQVVDLFLCGEDSPERSATLADR